MSRTVWINFERYAVTPDLAERPVFCAEMPPSSFAQAVPNTGHAVVTAWLDPVDGGARLAWLRLPDGRLVARPCGALRPPENIATRRILPRATRFERRLA